jgi:toxin ParE1/3/4
MLPVVLSPEAESDLVDIWTYIAKDKPRAADRVLDLIERKSQSIAQFPGIGAACPEIAKNLCCCWVGNYGIFYRANSAAIDVACVLHGTRDIPTIFRQ